MARNVFDDAHHDRIRTFAGGHTIGHGGYIIGSDKKDLLIWRNILHFADIQIPPPEVTIVFDADSEQAEASKIAALDIVSNDGILVAGMHFNMPGFGNISRGLNGYELLKSDWPTVVV